MTAREAVALLVAEGFVLKATTGHVQYEKNGVKIAVPNHKGDLKAHEVAHIRQAIRKASAAP